MGVKRWVLPKENPSLSAVLAKECGVSPLVASILVNRGKSPPTQASQFLSNDLTIGSPFELKDMQKAVERIKDAVDNGEKIAIYGDYDCDGITSTAMLYSYLSSIGADVCYYIPERDTDGYGLCRSGIDFLYTEQVNLIVTVDNGISAVEEVSYAGNLGIEVIITDHHQPSDTLPSAYAIVNPHRRDDTSAFKELCGAGVVCKLMIAMEEDLAFVLENYAELVAIGTVGDIVPLIDENRAFVKYGMDMLKVSNNLGLNALFSVSGINTENMTAQNIAFGIVPRINAAGRMGNAKLALELLLSEDEQEAEMLATKLSDMNKERQEGEVAILAEIDEMLMNDPSLLIQRVLILHGDSWSHGIIGILCSRLLERYGKPVMLLSSDGDYYKGSARSLGEFHLFKALNTTSDLLTQFGGHKLAAGFSLHKDDLDAFRKAIEGYARKNFDLMPCPTVMVDKILTHEHLTIETVGGLDVLKPYGALNEEPRFMLRSAIVESVTPISNGKHIRLALLLNNVRIGALYFGMTAESFQHKQGDSVDCIVSVELNTYNEKTTVSIKIKELRASRFNDTQNKFFAASQYYEKIIKNEPIDDAIIDRSIPKRDEIALIHKWLIQHNGFSSDIEQLYMHITTISAAANINYCKMRIILDILEEFKLIEFARPQGNIILKKSEGKVDLNDASLLKRLGKTIA